MSVRAFCRPLPLQGREGGRKERAARTRTGTPIGQVSLLKAIGSTDNDFLNGLIKQLVNVGSPGSSPDEDGTNFMLAVVKGIEPRDQVEAMLASQMAAVHNATMTLARRLAHVDNIPQQDSAQNAFNKLARTFAAQVRAEDDRPARPCR